MVRPVGQTFIGSSTINNTSLKDLHVASRHCEPFAAEQGSAGFSPVFLLSLETLQAPNGAPARTKPLRLHYADASGRMPPIAYNVMLT
jgi:hypothetical protein